MFTLQFYIEVTAFPASFTHRLKDSSYVRRTTRALHLRLHQIHNQGRHLRHLQCKLLVIVILILYQLTNRSQAELTFFIVNLMLLDFSFCDNIIDYYESIVIAMLFDKMIVFTMIVNNIEGVLTHLPNISTS